jgi:hypothetical protein
MGYIKTREDIDSAFYYFGELFLMLEEIDFDFSNIYDQNEDKKIFQKLSRAAFRTQEVMLSRDEYLYLYTFIEKMLDAAEQQGLLKAYGLTRKDYKLKNYLKEIQ